MNISFSPLYLLVFPPLLIAAGMLVDHWRRRRFGLGSGDAASRRRPRPLATVAGVILAAVASYDIAFFSAPPVHGRVLDIADGSPIAGARVQRRLYRVGAVRIGDSPRAVFVAGSRVDQTTRLDGTFSLPGWVSLWPSGFQGLSGMGWIVYEPSFMPALGCTEEGLNSLGINAYRCGGFNPTMYPDPWVSASIEASRGGVVLDVSVARRELPQDWAEALNRLAGRPVQDEWVELDVFVAEAKRCADGGLITEDIVPTLYRIAARSGYRSGTPYKVEEGTALAKIVAAYCGTNPSTPFCTAERLGIERQVLKYKELRSGR